MILARRARKTPVTFPHVRRAQLLKLLQRSLGSMQPSATQNVAFGAEIAQIFRAEIREMFAIFLHFWRRNAPKNQLPSLRKLREVNAGLD